MLTALTAVLAATAAMA
jgi:hypothetical protein